MSLFNSLSANLYITLSSLSACLVNKSVYEIALAIISNLASSLPSFKFILLIILYQVLNKKTLNFSVY